LVETSEDHPVNSLLKAEHSPKKRLTFDLIEVVLIMLVWGDGGYLLTSPTDHHHQCAFSNSCI